MKKKGIIYVGNDIHVSTLTGGIYETTKKEVEPDTASSSNLSNYKWARWGSDNDFPQRLINAVKADPIASLLEKKIAFHWGRGLMFYKKIVDEKGNEQIMIVDDDKVPAEIHDFMEANDWNNFQQGIITDCEWWQQYHVQYILNNAGRVLEIKQQRTKDVRPEKRNTLTGNIDNYYLSGYWPNPKSGEYAIIPAFFKNKNNSGIYCHKFVSVDKDYFNDPAWHSINRWLYIASKIPRWILANIDNSMNIKYHVEIPWKYFQDRCPIENYKEDNEQEKAIKELIEETFKKMDEYLAGEKNVHKAFYSFVHLMEDGKPAPGWKINVLENNLKDEAWLRAYGTSAMAMISGMGLSPSIAGTILPNGLGSGSGSDLREQFNFYIQVMTQLPREKTLEPWKLIKKRNGWPKELHLGYRDIVLQSVDQNKSGFATQNEQAPTADSQSKNTMSV